MDFFRPTHPLNHVCIFHFLWMIGPDGSLGWYSLIDFLCWNSLDFTTSLNTSCQLSNYFIVWLKTGQSIRRKYFENSNNHRLERSNENYNWNYFIFILQFGIVLRTYLFQHCFWTKYYCGRRFLLLFHVMS